jgi:hypothetical protein
MALLHGRSTGGLVRLFQWSSPLAEDDAHLVRRNRVGADARCGEAEVRVGTDRAGAGCLDWWRGERKSAAKRWGLEDRASEVRVGTRRERCRQDEAIGPLAPDSPDGLDVRGHPARQRRRAILPSGSFRLWRRGVRQSNCEVGLRGGPRARGLDPLVALRHSTTRWPRRHPFPHGPSRHESSYRQALRSIEILPKDWPHVACVSSSGIRRKSHDNLFERTPNTKKSSNYEG